MNEPRDSEVTDFHEEPFVDTVPDATLHRN